MVDKDYQHLSELKIAYDQFCHLLNNHLGVLRNKLTAGGMSTSDLERRFDSLVELERIFSGTLACFNGADFLNLSRQAISYLERGSSFIRVVNKPDRLLVKLVETEAGRLKALTDWQSLLGMIAEKDRLISCLLRVACKTAAVKPKLVLFSEPLAGEVIFEINLEDGR
ncbi:MAG TPA: hypothetical protein PKD37_06065 [Oligoflexia bacterium]|nr:hypothetical protein [Oligoflexia bacterium]HMP27526.1 hypothetical protein [Oligoflexia bacterium]